VSAMSSNSLRYLLRRLFLTTFAVTPLLHASPDVTVPPSFDDGWQAYESGDYREAARIWRILAERGHGSAQVNLGFMHDYGTGMARDPERAARWYRAAAIGGSAVGQYNLSLLISEGRVAPTAGRSARYWLEKAAAQGLDDATEALSARQQKPGSPQATQHRPTDLPAQESTANLAQARTDVLQVPVSIGTAWPVAAGYAVTNHHIIEGKRQVVLINNRGEELHASVVVTDAENDIAFLHVGDPRHLPPALPLSTSSAPLGTSVFTIGFPRIDIMGKSPKLSQGIISGTNGLRDDPSSYQISVPIQQGNSGGPLINMRGEVVGMITSMLGQTDAANGPAHPIPNISYALKTDVIRQLLTQLPAPAQGIGELQPAGGKLEVLAARVQDSVLIVKAE